MLKKGVIRSIGACDECGYAYYKGSTDKRKKWVSLYDVGDNMLAIFSGKKRVWLCSKCYRYYKDYI